MPHLKIENRKHSMLRNSWQGVEILHFRALRTYRRRVQSLADLLISQLCFLPIQPIDNQSTDQTERQAWRSFKVSPAA